MSPREAAQVTRRINGARKVVGRLRSLYFAKKGDPRTTLSVIFVESALALPREGTYHKYAYALTRLNDQQSLNRAIKELERKIESYENAPSGPAFVDLAERIKEAVLRGNRWMSDLCVLLNEEPQFLHDQRNAFLKWAKEYNTMVDELVEFSQETKEIGLPLYEGGPTYLRQFNGQFSFGHELIGASGV